MELVIVFGCGVSCGIVAGVLGVWGAFLYAMSQPGGH